MNKLTKIILNLFGLALVILLFNIPTFNKMQPQSAEPIIMNRDMPQVVRDYPETIEEMQRDMETGRMIRSLTPAERRKITPLKTLIETYAERDPEYPEEEQIGLYREAPKFNIIDEDAPQPTEYVELYEVDAPPKFGEPKNGDPHEPPIVQMINAVSNNFAKIMGGVVALSQALLNFRTFRNRKKGAMS